jgi:undecaprenyl-diphosphatase
VAAAIAGLLLIAAGLWLWSVPALDLQLHRDLRLHDALRWAARVRLFTISGTIPVVVPALLAGAWWLWRRGEGARAAWLLGSVAAGRIAVEIVKHIVHRPRPPLADRLAVENSFSMPSAHASGTMIAGLALVAALRLGRGWTAAALLFAAAIGWSRVALAVHWPSDVLVGWGFGLAWTAAALGVQPLQARSTSRNASP